MKTIVVTGATSGIGLEVARKLLGAGHTVITNYRNPARADLMRHELGQPASAERLFIFEGDFSNFSSVKAFAAAVRAQFRSIDVLINNAGTWEMSFKETADGIETNFQVNHLSPVLLTLELLPLLKRSFSPRIVNTSSGAHRRDILNLEDPQFRFTTYNGVASYSQSKLMNILFSLELTERLKGTGITVNTVHPGYVKSNLFSKMGDRDWSGVPDAAVGAQSALYAALSPELEGVSGKYIYLNREDPNLSLKAKDRLLAAKVWELSRSFISSKLPETEPFNMP